MIKRCTLSKLHDKNTLLFLVQIIISLIFCLLSKETENIFSKSEVLHISIVSEGIVVFIRVLKINTFSKLFVLSKYSFLLIRRLTSNYGLIPENSFFVEELKHAFLDTRKWFSQSL